MANNQGIYHLNLNGAVACKNRTAHMYVKLDEFRTINVRRCARCMKVLAKMDALAARMEAHKTVTQVSTPRSVL